LFGRADAVIEQPSLVAVHESGFEQGGELRDLEVLQSFEVNDPSHPGRLKVTVGRHVSLDLDEAQSLGRCGAGAELPRAIVIPAQKAAGRVWLGAR
jgi:hypothetical protein